MVPRRVRPAGRRRRSRSAWSGGYADHPQPVRFVTRRALAAHDSRWCCSVGRWVAWPATRSTCSARTGCSRGARSPINLVGVDAAGPAAGAPVRAPAPTIPAFLGPGVLGGFTTLSAFSEEARVLVARRPARRSLRRTSWRRWAPRSRGARRTTPDHAGRTGRVPRRRGRRVTRPDLAAGRGRRRPRRDAPVQRSRTARRALAHRHHGRQRGRLVPARRAQRAGALRLGAGPARAPASAAG